MKQFLIHSTKYDGSLHYRYASTVIREDASEIVLFGPAGTMLESYRGQYTAVYHMLQFFWSDRFYNLEVMWLPDWRPRMHYVNIATPATWDQHVLRYVDLDLDLIWRAGASEVILDDEDEFLLHQTRFSYPNDLIELVWRASEEVRELFTRRIYPFDGSLHAWRPEDAA